MRKTEHDLRRLPKAARPMPTTGQSADRFILAWDGMNRGEQIVCKAVNRPGEGRRVTHTVGELAAATRLTALQVRNALRRLVPGNWVERVETVERDDGTEMYVRGHYRITKGGRERLAAMTA